MRETAGQRIAAAIWGTSGQRRRHRIARRSGGRVGLEMLEPRQVLAALPVISEILTSNDRVIEDVDGDDSDYIELYNAGDDDMSLNRYYLTDDPDDLQKWRLPDVALPAGEYLVVFASNKDRNDPAGELHTNFRLSAAGDFLALVAPDGNTIMSQFDPYPQQVTDVSYGVPTGLTPSTLVGEGSAARVLIPTTGSLDPTEPNVVQGTWLQPDLDDSAGGWFDAQLGVGYTPPQTAVVLADSVAEFSGVQGQDNWRYGTWLKNLDANGIYSPNEFSELSGDRFFVAASNVWDVGLNGAAPSTEITATGGHPGTTSFGFLTHWAIRRWVSETEGQITITGTLGNPDPAGDGVIGKILVNGTEIYSQAVNGTSTEFSVTTTVALGDKVDFAIDDGGANNEVGDTTTFTAAISGVPHRELTVVPLADSSDDWERSDQQGLNNWHYGYYEQSADADRVYEATNFVPFSSGFWNGSRWEFPDPSLDTEIRSTSMGPHAANGIVHWAIRRWVSNADGTIVVDYDLAKAAAEGDGVTARVLHNGVEVSSFQLEGSDRTGVTRSVTIPGVSFGDTIDFAIDPLGPGVDPQQPDGTEDRTNMDVRISRIADVGESVSSDIRDAIFGVGTSAYVRIPFTVSDLGLLDQLTLKVKYDDAFVAYINGQLVASAGAPDSVNYASAALEPRAPEDATIFATFDLSDRRGLFVEGQNVLQVHVMNATASDDELLLLPRLEVGTLTAELDAARYFSTPSPGTPNGLGASRVGPLVVDSAHSPQQPAADQQVVVTAEISRTFTDVASVTLNYRVMYGDTVSVPMADDGQGSDEVAGDGLYTGVIPGGVATTGQMIRWYISARDSDGLSGRLPTFNNPATDQQYLGTIVADPSVQSNLPIYHWFVENATRASSGTETSGSLYYDGEFYDNVVTSLHGQSSQGFPKKSFNVDFPNDHRLRISDDLNRLEDVNWLTNYADKSLIRNTLAYEQLELLGGASHLAYPIRVQQNGQFFAIYDFVEDADWRWLDRLGYNTEGSLYKVYDTFTSHIGAEKKNRTEEDNTDLRDVIAGVRQTGDTGINYVMDNVNIAEMVNFMVGFALTANVDCCHKNYYAFRDTGNTDEWWFLPWDQDLSQGRVWGGFGLSYFDDTMYPNTAIVIGTNNTLLGKLYNNVPGFKDMFLRRLRSVMDEYVKPPGTPRDQLPLESRADELFELMKADAVLHNQKNPGNWGQRGVQTFEEGVQDLLNGYSAPRREYLYNTQVVADPGVGLPVLLSGEPGAATGTYFIPSDDSLGQSWTQPDFDDSSWASGPMGIGFELGASNYTDLIKTDLANQLEGRTSLYARIPFQVDDPDALAGLSLKMKYEDGYVAYLNGVEVHRANLREAEPTFNSTARSRSSRQATEFEAVNLSQFTNLLRAGENVLAIHSLNNSDASDDMFFLPEIVGGALSSSNGEVPLEQVGNPKIDIGTIDFNPSSGNQQQEYLQLTNNGTTSVDISGWRLDGDIEWTFVDGTVLPAGYTMYVSPDVRAFRSRTEGPSGGQQLFVQGNYQGLLPNAGGTVQLIAADGELVTQATYVGTVGTLPENLRISEIMYNPLDASAAELAADNSLISEDFEYIELVNISATETLDLAGVRFSAGVDFDFTGAAVSQLAPGARVLVVRNQAAFALRYGQAAADRVAGEFAANTALQDAGELLALITGDGSEIVDVEFSDNDYQGWPARADGAGSSLQIIDPSGDYQDSANWRASREIHGSPAVAELPASTSIVINEVLARSTAPQTDLVELYNPTAAAVSLANYYLSDSSDSIDGLQKFALPNVSLEAGEYIVFSESHFNAGGGNNPNDFALNADNGDQLYLTVGDATGPKWFVDDVSFGASAAGEVFGRTPNGGGRLYPNLAQTPYESNSAPRVGPIVITELMFAPDEPSPAALTIDPNLSSNDLEYIELFNPTAAPITLTEWRIRLGADFDFEAGASLPAGGTMVVVSFDASDSARLQAFRAHYGLSENVSIVGGYTGRLSAAGDGVQLQRPGTPPANDPTALPRLLEDEVIYDNVAPWPTDAASGGRALSRTAASAYGNSAASWIVTDPTPGVYVATMAGDLTGDGRVDSQDVASFHQAAMAGDLAADLTGNGAVDQDDLIYLIEELIGTVIGDVDFDGRFDSHDLVTLFQSGEFEDGVADNSTYADGDWNLDGEFTSDDLVFALQRGGYAGQPAQGARPAVRADVAVAAAVNRPADLARRRSLQAASYDAVFSDSDRDWFDDVDDATDKDELLTTELEL